MTANQPQDIDEYIAGFPIDVQKILGQVRATVKKAAPEAKETIKYAMPTFVLKGKPGTLCRFQKSHRVLSGPDWDSSI